MQSSTLDKSVEQGAALAKIEAITPLSEQVAQTLKHYLNALDKAVSPHNVYQLVLEQVEVPLIKTMLEYTGFNRLKTAKYLGVSRTTLHTKLSKYGLNEWIKATQYRDSQAIRKQWETSSVSSEAALALPVEESV